jgi:hypothetical protein
LDVDIDFGVLLDLERRWFDTIESKRPIFLHANSGNRIVGCNICYSHLLNVRYCSVGFLGVMGWTDWVPLLKEGVLGGLRGSSIDDLGLNWWGVANILVACDFGFRRVSGCATGSEIRGLSDGGTLTVSPGAEDGLVMENVWLALLHATIGSQATYFDCLQDVSRYARDQIF